MVAADDDGRAQFAGPDHFVEGEAEAVAVTEADPADARRQALEGDALARHVEPVVQMRVAGGQFLHLGIGLVDILRIARQGRPAERADAAAEQRADIGRHEARESEGVFEAFVLGDLADIVAIIERRHAGLSRSRSSPRHARASRRGRPSRRPSGSLSRLAFHSAMVQPFGR